MASSAAALLSTKAWGNAPLNSLRPVQRNDDFQKQLQPQAAALIERAKLGGDVGFAVMDNASGLLLETENSDFVLPPASVAKVMTAAYALDALGPDHRFVTEVMVTGPVANGQIDGDVILLGSGDPTLDTDGLADLASRLHSAGVRKITGRYLVWEGALPYVRSIDEGQPAHVGYSPAVSGLNLNYNRVHFNWSRTGNEFTVAMEAASASRRPTVRMARMQIEARSVPVYTYMDRNGRDEWTVARSALGNGGARWLPVRKPGLYAAEVFQNLAKAQGISLPDPVFVPTRPAGSVLAQHESGPLREILRDMLKWSTNLTAEVVGLAATGAKIGRPARDLKDSAQHMSRWASAEYGLSTMDFVDHSGLGEQSRISASDMVRALQKMRKTRDVKSLLKAFAMRDEQRRVIKDHPISVHAKTGTLNFVSGLAGFADLPDGRELVFAIFTANLALRADLSMAEREKPPGGSSWNRRSKTLQQALIERWGVVYAKY